MKEWEHKLQNADGTSGVKFKKEKDFSIKLKNIKSYSGEKMKDFSVSGINFSEKYRFDKRNRQWQKF